MITILRFALVLALVLPAAARAACDGRDLRATLPADARATLDAAVAATPFPVGNHWRAERGDEVIHLVGTVHLSDPRLDAPLDRLRPLIEDAGAVMLEMTQDEEATLTQEMARNPSLLLLQDTTLPELMPEDEWTRLADAMRARGMPPFMAAKFQPWYVSMLLSIPPCAAAQLTEQNGLDARIEALADEAGVPTYPLEPWQTAIDIFAAASVEEQVRLISVSLTGADQAEDQFATLLASYFEEALAESWEMSRLLAPEMSGLPRAEADAMFAEIEEVLLLQRNRDWIPVILDRAARTDGPLFVAFGAAHLPGDEGILQLLADQGFTLTRQPF